MGSIIGTGMSDDSKKPNKPIPTPATTELYRVLRPTRFEDVFGQPEAVAQLQEFERKNRFPHTMLFHGDSGCGKTTLIRIVKEKLGCSGSDYVEINSASSRGIDTIRDLEQYMNLAPMAGKSRVFAFDECHRMTPESQDAALKLLEDVPRHVYFMLSTTRLEKVIATVKSRCTQIAIKAISPDVMKQLLISIGVKDPRAKVSVPVIEKIVEVANGSARVALVILNQVMGMPTEAAQLNAIQKLDVKEDSFKIVKALLWGKTTWAEMAKILLAIEDEAEGIRRMVLATARTELLKANANAKRAFCIITSFESTYPWDAGKSGLASLARACYEVCMARE